jgi:pimeloyl-ACP methyl ester carboxylesterase
MARRTGFVCLLAVVLIVGTPVPAFAGGGSADPGKVLSVASMKLVPALANVATGKRITYVSRDPNGQAIVVSGAVLTPKPVYLLSRPKGANKIVAWAHGTAGLADMCAPSAFPNLYPDPAYNNYADTVASYLMQGWTVTATDYPGLGTSGPHPYLIGESEGRAVIDSVRAARNLNTSLSNLWVVAGHSQGGQAALFAGEIADTYGMGLQLKGVVAVAPISNEDLIGPGLIGTPIQGYLVLAIYGLAALDPTVHPAEILAPPALNLTGVLDTGCFNEIIAAYAPLTADQLLIGGVLPDSIIAKAAQNNPAQQSNNAPVFLVQGDADTTIPLELTELLLQEECAVNTVPTQLGVYPGQDHDPVLYAAQSDIVNYITARFANQPAASSC